MNGQSQCLSARFLGDWKITERALAFAEKWLEMQGLGVIDRALDACVFEMRLERVAVRDLDDELIVGVVRAVSLG